MSSVGEDKLLPAIFPISLHFHAPPTQSWLDSQEIFAGLKWKRVHVPHQNLLHPMRCDISHRTDSYLHTHTHTHTHTDTHTRCKCIHAHKSVQIPFTTLMLPPSCDINSYVNAPLMRLFACTHARIHTLACAYTQTYTYTNPTSMPPWSQLKSLTAVVYPQD